MIYLDHAAATPVNKTVLKAMEPYFVDDFFNPSSPYLPAKKVRADYEEAKDKIAHSIGAKGNDIIITSGATESINLAFTAVNKKTVDVSQKEPVVLILSTEHASVRETAKQFNHQEIKVKKDGRIDLADFSKKLTHNVQLVSISLVNNEIGTIQPLAEISQIIEKERSARFEKGINTPIFLHSDASQALNLLDINISRLGVDLLTLNAAKIGGPKGVGALYVNHGIKLNPINRGGGQERGLRSGTENVPGVIGFAIAITEAKSHLSSNRKKYSEFKKLFISEINKNIKNCDFISSSHQLTNFCPLVFSGLDAERLIYKLENQEIYVSTGAACAANKGQKSHVLIAIGLSDEAIAGSLRVTFGATNTSEQIVTAAKIISEIAKKETLRIAKKA